MISDKAPWIISMITNSAATIVCPQYVMQKLAYQSITKPMHVIQISNQKLLVILDIIPLTSACHCESFIH